MYASKNLPQKREITDLLHKNHKIEIEHFVVFVLSCRYSQQSWR